jgi:hypothetical protein
MNLKDVKKRAKSGSIGRQGHFFATYDHLAPAGTTVEDLLNYQYWVDEAHMFDVANKIEVICEDLSFRCLLLVERAEKRVGAKMRVIEYQDFTGIEGAGEDLPELSADYAIEFMGANKWCVTRNGDSAIVYKGGKTRMDAETALRNHIKALAA